jgi:hypothetical protein
LPHGSAESYLNQVLDKRGFHLNDRAFSGGA